MAYPSRPAASRLPRWDSRPPPSAPCTRAWPLAWGQGTGRRLGRAALQGRRQQRDLQPISPPQIPSRQIPSRQIPSRRAPSPRGLQPTASACCSLYPAPPPLPPAHTLALHTTMVTTRARGVSGAGPCPNLEHEPLHVYICMRAGMASMQSARGAGPCRTLNQTEARTEDVSLEGTRACLTCESPLPVPRGLACRVSVCTRAPRPACSVSGDTSSLVKNRV